MDLYLNIGAYRLTVNPYRITGMLSRELNSKLEDALMKSLFKELPPAVGESKKAYEARYKKWQEDKKAAKKDESTTKSKSKKAEDESKEEEDNITLKDWVRKSLNLTKYDEQMEYLYDCVKAIADTFDNQGHKVTQEVLDSCPLVDVNNFVFKVCKYSRVPIGLEEIVLPYDDFS